MPEAGVEFAKVSYALASGRFLLQDISLEDQVGEFSLSHNLDQAGRFQLFHVMGEGRGADAVGLVEDGAGRGVFAGSELFEDLIASWLGQCTGDLCKLPIRHLMALGDCHRLTLRPIRFAWQVRSSEYHPLLPDRCKIAKKRDRSLEKSNRRREEECRAARAASPHPTNSGATTRARRALIFYMRSFCS